MRPLVDEVLRLLRGYPLVQDIRVLHCDETPASALELKVRCQLPQNHQLQIWLHLEPGTLDYAYQLFTDRPLLRWDNAPHYPQVTTAPHHFHDQTGQVGESSLSGDPLNDLAAVLAEIERRLSPSR